MSIFYNVLQFFLGIFEVWGCYHFLDLFFKKKYESKMRKRIIFFCIFITAVLITINRQIAGYSHTLILLVIILTGLVSVWTYNTQKRAVFSVVALYYLTLTLFELFFVYSIGIILKQSDFGIQVTTCIGKDRIIIFSLARGLMFVICMLIQKKEEACITFIPLNIRVVYIILIVESIGIFIFQSVYGYDYTLLLISGWYVFCLIIVLLSVCFFVYFLYKSKQEEIKYINLKNELLEYNYNNIYEIYMRNGRIYHDIKNHLTILSQYIKQDEKENALAYIESIKGPIFYLDNRVWSGIKVIDFVLNYKQMEAEKEQIKIVYEIDLIKGTDFLIQDSELCALLSNLLDNAIEANKFVEEDKRKIHVIIRYLNHMLMILVENTLAEAPEKKDGRYITKKKNKQEHGIGMSIIQNIVTKYEGWVDIKYDVEQFCVDLTLFC